MKFFFVIQNFQKKVYIFKRFVRSYLPACKENYKSVKCRLSNVPHRSDGEAHVNIEDYKRRVLVSATPVD